MLNENVSEIDFLFTSKMSKGNMTISFIYSYGNEYTELTSKNKEIMKKVLI